MKNKLADARLEKGVIGELMKRAKRRYFEEKSISKEEYDLTVRKYRDDLNDLKESIPVLEGRLRKKKIKRKG